MKGSSRTRKLIAVARLEGTPPRTFLLFRLPQALILGSPDTMSITRDRTDVQFETLLTAEGRACLPMRRLVLLYLNPFALFMDASHGPAWRRQQALSHNRARRGMLLTYLRRWLLIAAASFLGIASAEALAAHVPLFIIPAAGFGIACSVAITVAACTCTAYVLLGSRSPWQ